MGETVRWTEKLPENMEGSIPATHSGPKHLSHGLIGVSHGEGGWEKLDASTDLSRLNLMARSQHPFCKSLRIDENEIARGQKTASQLESINLNSSILKEACQKTEAAKQAIRRPLGIN